MIKTIVKKVFNGMNLYQGVEVLSSEKNKIELRLSRY